VFLLRLKNGYSRPVSIYAKTDVKQLVKPAKQATLYIEAEKTVNGKGYYAELKDSGASGGKYILLSDRNRKTAQYSFNISKAGKYFVAMRVKSDKPVSSHDSLQFSVDGGEMKTAHLQSDTCWTWALAANNDQHLKHLKAFKLKKGKHIIKVMPKEAIYLDLIAITEKPELFEPR
jgi:hypothetical protein